MATCHVLLEVTDPSARTSADPSEIRLFTKARNEGLRFPAFLRHYRNLGVKRFFVVDNDSTDGSPEYLKAQPDVVLFRTKGQFREARGGTDWLNAALSEFGVGHWCVTVDVDELLYFAGSEHTTLQALTAYLDRNGYEAMGALLLDLYPGTPLADCSYAAGDDLVQAAPYFDSGPYDYQPHSDSPGYLIYGGVRQRIFFPESLPSAVRRAHVALYHRVLLSTPVVKESKRVLEHRPHFPPLLTKAPIVKWERSTSYLNVNHFVSKRKVAPENSVLLHFKFLQDFHQRAVEEARRGQYYDGAIEFRRYSARLAKEPKLNMRGATSIRFEGSDQLLQLGLLQDSEGWKAAREPGSGG